MNIEPKVLNTSSHGYGLKQYRQAWESTLTIVFGGGGFLSINEKLERGGYHQAAEDAVKHLWTVEQGLTIGMLEKLDEASLACFFIIGEAYLKTENIDNAIGAFHVVYSQIGFTKYMLKSPVNFAHYCEMAKERLEDIAKTHGPDKVINYEMEAQPSHKWEDWPLSLRFSRELGLPSRNVI